MVENAKLPPKSLKELNWLVGKIGVTPEVPIGVDDVVDLRSHRRRRECGDIAVAGGGPADEVVLACRQVDFAINWKPTAPPSPDSVVVASSVSDDVQRVTPWVLVTPLGK
jgi:hypothetical protein